MAQLVKDLPTMQETWVLSLVGKIPLEKKVATHSSTLAWKIPWTKEWDRLQSMELQRVGYNCATNFHFFTNGSCHTKFLHSDGLMENIMPNYYVNFINN